MDGRKLVIGDADGTVSMWALDKELTMHKNDDFNKLERLIA